MLCKLKERKKQNILISVDLQKEKEKCMRLVLVLALNLEERQWEVMKEKTKATGKL